MNTIESSDLSPEEILAPPRVDLIGAALAVFLSLVVWLVVGGTIFFLIYLSSGEFLLESGILSIIFGMIAFVGLSLGNFIYVYGLGTIFPHIYTAGRSTFVQVSVFSIILYIVMSLVYFFVGSNFTWKSGVIGVYAFHTLINSFGILLIVSLLAHYRYSLLAFYASIVSLILTGLFVFFVYIGLSESGAMIFIFLGLTTTAYTLSTLFYYGFFWLYYQMYIYSGSDLLWDILSSIERDEKMLESDAEKALFKK